MNVTSIADTTTMLRKGEEVIETEVQSVRVVEVFAMPHVSAAEEHWELIDMHFVVIGVDIPEFMRELVAESFRGEIASYPAPERLKGGPSYIEIGAVLGSQDAALRWMALGSVLDYWRIMTPEKAGITGDDADALAGQGFVMVLPTAKLGEVLGE